MGATWLSRTGLAIRPVALACGLGLIGLAGPALAGEGDGGRQVLEAAGKQKQAAYSLQDDARELALIAAARSFEAVLDDATHDLDVRVEAAFRAGEILRARDQADEAARLFERGHELGSEPPAGPDAEAAERERVEHCREFAARCLLERGHLERRAERGEQALSLYSALAEGFGDCRRQAAHGQTWRVRMLLELGRAEEAGACVREFGETYPEYALECVRNLGRVVEELVDAGRRDQADALAGDVAAVLRAALDKEVAPDQPVGDALAAVRVTLSGGAG